MTHPDPFHPVDPAPPRPALDRRAVIRAAGLITLAGGGLVALAGCAPAETTGEATPAPTPSPVSPSPEPSSPSRPSVAESAVPVGGGVILDGADYVITQPSDGEFKAFTKICTHQRCAVTAVTETIDCSCHGSKFSIADGSVQNGPATQPLQEFGVQVAGGQVYVQA